MGKFDIIEARLSCGGKEVLHILGEIKDYMHPLGKPSVLVEEVNYIAGPYALPEMYKKWATPTLPDFLKRLYKIKRKVHQRDSPHEIDECELEIKIKRKDALVD